MNKAKIAAVTMAAGLTLTACGSNETTTYLESQWDKAGHNEKGMTCLVWLAEPDPEMGLGQEALLDQIHLTPGAPVEFDREAATDFFNEECEPFEELKNQ